MPFVDKIWMCLKYEVRNGEIQDAITNTLTVLSTLAGRLDGDDLKAFAQAVLNDCLDDLENPTYSSQAGKLLASIFGAKVCAFTHMVPPILSRVKRIHRQTASPSNTKDLFTLLNSILERRLALTSNKSAWQESDVNSMKGASSSLPALFEDVYRPAWEQSLAKRTIKEQRDLLKIAFQGMALLVQQVDVSLDDSRRSLLCPDTTCSQICSILFIPVVEWTLPENEAIREPVLEDEAVVAMQKAVMVYGAAFDDLITRSLSLAKNTCSRSDVAPSEKAIHLRSVLSRLSFIGCSELSARTSSLQFFGVLAGSLLAEMRGLFDQGANFEVASLYLSGIHGAALNLADALRRLPRLEDVSQASTERQDLGKWIHNVEKHFQGFPRIDQASDGAQPGVVAITPTAQAGRSMSINMQFLQLCLFIVYQLYRRATVLAPHGESVDLGLSPDFQDAGTSGEEAQDRYLFSLGRFATFVIRSLSGPDQQALRLYEEAVVLFRGEDVLGDGQTVRHVKLESLSNESTNTSTVRLSPLHNRRTAILSMAILEGLRSEGLIDLVSNS